MQTSLITVLSGLLSYRPKVGSIGALTSIKVNQVSCQTFRMTKKRRCWWQIISIILATMCYLMDLGQAEQAPNWIHCSLLLAPKPQLMAMTSPSSQAVRYKSWSSHPQPLSLPHPLKQPWKDRTCHLAFSALLPLASVPLLLRIF